MIRYAVVRRIEPPQTARVYSSRMHNGIHDAKVGDVIWHGFGVVEWVGDDYREGLRQVRATGRRSAAIDGGLLFGREQDPQGRKG